MGKLSWTELNEEVLYKQLTKGKLGVIKNADFSISFISEDTNIPTANNSEGAGWRVL